MHKGTVEMDAATCVEQMISLFNAYSEDFGLTDAEFPDDKPEERQCDFRDKFNALICCHKGHDIGPDQCGKPEHDFCYRCRALRIELGVPDFRKTAAYLIAKRG